MTLAVLIRAHQFTAQEALLAERVEAAFGGPVHFVADESHGPVDTGRFARIGLTRKRVRSLIVGRVPGGWGWQCGDVFLYAAREALPHATAFAMIEGDVFLSEAAAERLARLFQSRTEDVLVAQLGHRDPPHLYARDLERLGEDNSVTCFFPVTRVSAHAVDEMQALRQRERSQNLKLNDEAILASIAHRSSFASANLTQIAEDLFDPTGFTPERTQLFEFLREAHVDPRILHPVRNVDALLAKIEQMGAVRNLRRRYREALQQAAPRHRQQLRKALAEADARRRAKADASLAQSRQPH